MDKFLKFFSSIGQFGEVGLVCLGGRPVVYVYKMYAVYNRLQTDVYNRLQTDVYNRLPHPVIYAFIDLLYYLNCLRAGEPSEKRVILVYYPPYRIGGGVAYPPIISTW